MLTQEQVIAKREELRTLQQESIQQAYRLEEQQQLLMRQQNAQVLQLQNLQGQIDALTMVLTGEPEKKEEPDARKEASESSSPAQGEREDRPSAAGG